MSSHSSSTLDTLQEETAAHESSLKSNVQQQRRRGKSGSFPKSSSISSGNSKTVGLGIARRPSDNLLMNLAQEEQPIIAQPPSRKNLISRYERPISNDSIVTESTELFSSNPNSTASSTSNNSRGSSIIDDLDESVKQQGEETSQEDAGDDSTLDYSSSLDTDLSVSTHGQPKTRYMFSNSTMARSQLSFAANNPSPLKNNVNRASPVPRPLHSKSAPSLPQETVLTPSQRYRLRREQSKVALQKSIKQREQYYDEQENSFESLANESVVDDALIWNIPVASHSTNSFLMSMKPSPKKSKQKPPKFSRSTSLHSMASASSSSCLDFREMPTSPLPGVHKTSDLQFYQQTSENLSTIYQHSSNQLSRNKLLERTTSTEFLPFQFKSASDEGMEDLKLVSEDKVQLCSPSRPTWLPPKPTEERKSHEREINKTISMASIDLLDRSKEREEREIRNETNRQKLFLLLDRGITRQSSLHDLKKITWETALTPETRYEIYDAILQSDIRFISENFIEPLRNTTTVLDKMEFPRSKQSEIEKLINKIPSIEENELSRELTHLLKLKSISSQGLLPGDEFLFYHFLSDKSFGDLNKVWEMVHLIQSTCFNDLTREKFDSRVLSSRGVIANYLTRDDSFKNEFNSKSLNVSTWWNILQRMDHEMFMWCLDIIVVHNSQPYKNSPIDKEAFEGKSWDYYRSKKVVVNYKILCSLMLNVLLNYHFGFDDLNSLASLKDQDFRIPCSMEDLLDASAVHEVFVKKWQHYYKKF